VASALAASVATDRAVRNSIGIDPLVRLAPDRCGRAFASPRRGAGALRAGMEPRVPLPVNGGNVSPATDERNKGRVSAVLVARASRV